MKHTFDEERHDKERRQEGGERGEGRRLKRGKGDGFERLGA